MQNSSLWELLLHLKSHSAKHPSLEPETRRSANSKSWSYFDRKYQLLKQKEKFERNKPEFVGCEHIDFTVPVCPIRTPVHLFSSTSHTLICIHNNKEAYMNIGVIILSSIKFFESLLTVWSPEAVRRQLSPCNKFTMSEHQMIHEIKMNI